MQYADCEGNMILKTKKDRYIEYLKLENSLNKELISAQKELIKAQSKTINNLEGDLFECKFKIHSKNIDKYIAVESRN